MTAIYSVLVEGDDMTEPVADATKAILDGHLVLSRNQASRGIYPAVDPLQSVSRIMSDVVSSEHKAAATAVRDALAAYRDAEDLLSIGAYSPGSNPRIDAALDVLPDIEQLILQSVDEHPEPGSAVNQLMSIATRYAQTLRAAAGGGQ